MKKAKKEADTFAKSELDKLKKKSDHYEISEEDLLPNEDKGKKFDSIAANNGLKEVESSEISLFLGIAKKREEIEEGEAILIEANAIAQSPSSSDIVSLSTSLIPEEEKVQICREEGAYQVAFTQSLHVEATPEIKKTIKHCKGHEKEKSFFWKSDAEEEKTAKKKKLSKDPEIESYHVDIHHGSLITDYLVTSKYKHRDDASTCTAFSVEERVIQEAREKDTWQTQDQEGLSFIESNPFCKLLYSQISQGPETRTINNQPIFRDSWGRHLFFSCEPASESKCKKLRDQGGILISKKCIEENCLGECDLWEKTFDLGKKSAYQTTKATFKDQEIWGIEDGFETSYDKNLDFGSSLMALSVFSDLKSNLEKKDSDYYKDLEIFKGEELKCQKSFIDGKAFDCCKKMEGLAVKVKLAHCNSEEKCLAEKRYLGNCRFIGTKKVNFGTVTEHVYCCFPTKLSRVLQEQGRKQLGMKWGSASSPKCHGFTLDELQKIDFEKVDFSEVVDDIKIDKHSYEKRVKSSVQSLQVKVESEIQRKSQEELKNANH